MKAQRSATAAKEIKELIGRSVETVDVGARLVDEAGKIAVAQYNVKATGHVAMVRKLLDI